MSKLQICNRRSIGEPYPFATLKTELELTVKEKVWTAVVVALGLGMIALMGIGAMTVWRWL